MLHSLQKTKFDALLLLLLLKTTQTKVKQQQAQQQKRVDYISVIYNKFLYAYMTHTYAAVN